MHPVSIFAAGSLPQRNQRDQREISPFGQGKEDHTVSFGLKVGERVKIMSLRTHGTLTSIDESLSQVEVMTHQAKVTTALADVVRVTDGEEEKEKEFSKDPYLSPREVQEFPSQLNVIGLTVEDALPKVDQFIDQALLHGLEKIHIIHGIGSGRLRNAIGKYLQDTGESKILLPEIV